MADHPRNSSISRSAGRGLASALLCLVALPMCEPSREVDLKLRLQPGDSRTVTMTDESQLSVEVITVDKRPQIPAEVLGEKVTESPTFREVFTLDVENVAADGSGTVKATFTELELSGVSLVTKLLEGIEDIGEVSLEGGNFRMTLCQDGRVTTVTGMNALADEVSEKQMKAMLKQAERLPRQSRDEFESRIAQVKDALGTMAGALLGDDSTRERMEGWLNIYPASPVRVGDTWNKTRATYNPFAPIVIADTWQLKESRDGVATLERRADITPNNQAPLWRSWA